MVQKVRQNCIKWRRFSPIHTVLFQKCGRSVSENQNNTNEKEHILQTVQN